MLKSNIKNSLVINSLIDLGDDIAVESKGKGRKFISKFIEPGVAHYDEFGDVLITKETLDKFINTMVGCPVIIKHKDITDKNVDKERVGVISNVWYNNTDGWFYCDGIIWDKQAIDLVKNQGWNVSCTYDFESDKQKKIHNGKAIDMEFTGGEFLHLALVPNPRYERANIVMNAKDRDEDIQWITVKGNHIPIKKGQSKDEAVKEFIEKQQGKTSDKKEGSGDKERNSTRDFRNHLGRIEKLIKKYNLEPHEEDELLDELGSFEAKLDENLEPREEEELRERLYDFEDDIKRHHEMKKEEAKEEKKENTGYSMSDKYKNHIQFESDKEAGGYPRKIYKSIEEAKKFYEYKKEGQKGAEEANLKQKGKRGVPVRDFPVIVKSPIGDGYVVATVGLAEKHNLKEVYPVNRSQNSLTSTVLDAISEVVAEKLGEQ